MLRRSLIADSEPWENRFARTPMTAFEVEARSPAVTHTVTMRKIEDWLQSSAKSPAVGL